jgi:hypothetical protein
MQEIMSLPGKIYGVKGEQIYLDDQGRKQAFENVIGLWKDRDDLGDAEEYVRAIRRGLRLIRFSR